MNRFGRCLWNTQRPQVTANALKYGPHPQKAEASFDRKNTVLTETGDCRGELLTWLFQQENTMNALKPPNPSKTEVLQGHKTPQNILRPQGLIRWVHAHTFINKCACKYNLACSCFLISSTTWNEKEQKIWRLPLIPRGLVCTAGNTSICWLTKVQQCCPPVWQARGWEAKVHQNLCLSSRCTIPSSFYIFIHCCEWAEDEKSTQSGPGAVW